MRSLSCLDDSLSSFCAHCFAEYRDIDSIQQLAPHRLREIKRFFEDYKKNENKDVLVEDFFGPEEARKVIQQGIERYQKEIAKKHKYMRIS